MTGTPPTGPAPAGPAPTGPAGARPAEAADAGPAGAGLLSLEALTVVFPGAGRRAAPVRAVDGVSLSIGAGRVLVLIGESGSGKSTVLNAIAGLLPPGVRADGRLTLAGRPGNLLSDRPAARRGVAGREIGMVFQNPAASLNPVVPVGRQVAAVAAHHRGLDRRAGEAAMLALFGHVGIDRPAVRARAYPHQLSGGLKQRVAIAAALAGRPRVLLADEPTTALDATVQAQILDLLLALVDGDGLALVLVTHDLAVAGAIADEIAVMVSGRIVERGPARVLVDEPAHPYTAALAAAALPFDDRSGLPGPGSGGAAVAPAAGAEPAGSSTEPGCVYRARCPLAVAQCRTAPPLAGWRGREVACHRAGEGAGVADGGRR